MYCVRDRRTDALELTDVIVRMAGVIRQQRRDAARKVEHGVYGLEAALNTVRDSERALATLVIDNIELLVESLSMSSELQVMPLPPDTV